MQPIARHVPAASTSRGPLRPMLFAVVAVAWLSPAVAQVGAPAGPVRPAGAPAQATSGSRGAAGVAPAGGLAPGAASTAIEAVTHGFVASVELAEPRFTRPPRVAYVLAGTEDQTIRARLHNTLGVSLSAGFRVAAVDPGLEVRLEPHQEVLPWEERRPGGVVRRWDDVVILMDLRVHPGIHCGVHAVRITNGEFSGVVNIPVLHRLGRGAREAQGHTIRFETFDDTSHHRPLLFEDWSLFSPPQPAWWSGTIHYAGGAGGGTLYLTTSHPSNVELVQGRQQPLGDQPATLHFSAKLTQSVETCLDVPVEIVANIKGGPATGDKAAVMFSIDPPAPHH
jgi:hypothetical protein